VRRLEYIEYADARPGWDDRRGEGRRGAERRGEARRGEERRGEARRGEERRGEERRDFPSAVQDFKRLR
jgi:hypothetical protein